jgi:hypothetical protein
MTAPYVDIDPEAILVPQRLESSALGDNAPQEDVSRWHIIDAERAQTWCGLFMSRAWERRPFSKTPEDGRCETCVSRFGQDVVRS